MDHRILIAAMLGLVLLAFGGFYFALKPGSHEPVVHPPQTATGTAPAAPNAPAQGSPAQPAKSPATPAAKATAASIEAEIAQAGHAELQALLRKNFAREYNELIAVAVRRRNEGVSDEAFGQELFTHFQDMMRSKLKFAVGASTQMIDSLAANEVNLFHALGTEGPAFCLKVLGKDNRPVQTPLPENISRMMRLGTIYRFRAIVEGMPNFKPIDPLTADEMAAFDTSLARDGLKFDEVRTGAFLSKQGNEPGKPCLMVEKLYLAIARLGEMTRRKLYAGMFFLGRDQ
jgi:hypothetical protein